MLTGQIMFWVFVILHRSVIFTMVELATPIRAYLIACYYVCLQVIQRYVWNT